VIRTRVGYAGGTKKEPTYRHLGDHSETIQIDYDPSQISYITLLDIFWKNHNPHRKTWSRQYASLIFYHNDEQKTLATGSKDRLQTATGNAIYTEIIPHSTFYFTEDYHQKYYLRRHRDILQEFTIMYPDIHDFLHSTATARVNGYLAGYGSFADLKSEIGTFGLSPEGRSRLLGIVYSLSR